jgi:hypothetical protein
MEDMYFFLMLLGYVQLIKCCVNVHAPSEGGAPTGKRPLGRPSRRWEVSIRMDLEEIGINMRIWVDSAQDGDHWRALVNVAWNLWVP